jgi:hypothetical protein
LGHRTEKVTRRGRTLHSDEIIIIIIIIIIIVVVVVVVVYVRNTTVYPKVSGLAYWSEKCKWYGCLPLGAVVPLFYESV